MSNLCFITQLYPESLHFSVSTSTALLCYLVEGLHTDIPAKTVSANKALLGHSHAYSFIYYFCLLYVTKVGLQHRHPGLKARFTV